MRTADLMNAPGEKAALRGLKTNWPTEERMWSFLIAATTVQRIVYLKQIIHGVSVMFMTYSLTLSQQRYVVWHPPPRARSGCVFNQGGTRDYVTSTCDHLDSALLAAVQGLTETRCETAEFGFVTKNTVKHCDPNPIARSVTLGHLLTEKERSLWWLENTSNSRATCKSSI